MYRTLRAATALAALALVSACGGGNGVAELEASTILDKAVTAAKEAQTTHVKGQLTRGSQSFALDLRLADKGATGTLAVEGNTMNLRRLGQKMYLKADRTFYASQGAPVEARKQLAGKWLQLRTGRSGFGPLAAFTKPDQLFSQFLNTGDSVTKGNRTEVRGTPAIELNLSKKRGAMLVALEGKPYPLQIRSGAKSPSEGTLNFVDYNRPLELKTPPPDQILPASKLGAGAPGG